MTINNRYTDDNYCPIWAEELVSCEDCIYCDTPDCENVLNKGARENGKEMDSRRD